MRFLSHRLVLALGLSAAAMSAQAVADVVESTFGPNDGFFEAGFAVWGPDSQAVISQNQAGQNLGEVATGAEFGVSSSYSLNEIDLALTWYGGTNAVDVSLWSASGGIPNAQLDSWSLTQLAGTNGGNPGSVMSISGISGITLQAGASYWLVVTPGAADTDAGWNLNGDGPAGALPQTIWGQSNNGSWTLINTPPTDPSQLFYSPAFDVVATPTPVPLPAAAWLLLSGLGGLALTARKRRAA